MNLMPVNDSESSQNCVVAGGTVQPFPKQLLQTWHLNALTTWRFVSRWLVVSNFSTCKHRTQASLFSSHWAKYTEPSRQERRTELLHCSPPVLTEQQRGTQGAAHLWHQPTALQDAHLVLVHIHLTPQRPGHLEEKA